MSTTAIPVASFGNNPKVAQAIREKLLPEYDGLSSRSSLTLPLVFNPSLNSDLNLHPSHLNLHHAPFSLQPSLTNHPTVVHTTLTLPTSLSELPALCSGTPSPTSSPSSNLGSNASASSPAEIKVPKAIIFGGGVSAADAEQVKEAVLAKNAEVKFVRLTREDMVAAGAEGPDPEVIGRLLKEKLGEVLA